VTYLQIVNQVLRRLRESEVTSVTQSGYSALIGDFINETKREVEDSWNWVLLRTTIQVPTVSGTFRYTLTDAGNRFRFLHAFNDTADLEMFQIPSKKMTQNYNGGNVLSGSPINFDFNGGSNGDPSVDVWPQPSSVENLNFDLVVPQEDLSGDETVILVPTMPILLGAYSKALSERGEDGGQQFGEVLSAANKALSDAIAIDAANLPFELMWEVQ